jgi:hypothetical protein
MIERVERFVTKGQTFDSVAKAIEYREGLVEKFLRSQPGWDTMRHKDRTAFVEGILSNRHELRDLLNYDTPPQ